MNTAVQALLWKNVRLTWRFFLLQQIMVITLVALTIGVLMPEEAGPDVVQLFFTTQLSNFL